MNRILLLTSLTLFACKSEPAKELAPTAAQPLEAAKPATAGAKKFTIASDASKVTWTMNAPLEVIYGDVPGGVSGELFVDPADLTKTTGLVQVDLSKLVLFQQKREDETKEYGEKTMQPKQNEHAKAWLEISPETPEETKKANERAQLKLLSVTATGGADLTKLAGGETRIFRGVIAGEMLLHGRKAQESVEVEVTFTMSGEDVKEIKVRSVKPMIVSLEEHDVRPREAFGKLAAKTLQAMGNKVAQEAPIDIELIAR